MPQYSIDEEIELLAEAGLLTERQAQAYVYREVELWPLHAVADELDLTKSTISDYAREAGRKIDAAEATLDALGEIRDQIADECSECGAALGGRYATDETGAALCFECAGVEPAEF